MEKLKDKVNYFSAKTGKFYQLVPTRTVPVLKINAVPMHRFAKIDPLTDAKLKISALKPQGHLLEICTGLGYTAIQSAELKEVESVTTIEADSEVLDMARMNPDSRELFENTKIEIIEGLGEEVVKEMKSDSFDCILHDPPTFVVSPELYSRNFYRELYRVLKKDCILWHYCPEPGKAGPGKKNEKFISNTIKRLEEVGFVDVKHDKESCGILAKKKY